MKASKLSIIPSTTGATKTVGKVLPQLKGKLNGIAFRVPTETVSIVELVLELEKEAKPEEINKIFEIKGILKTEPEVRKSSDYKKNPYSSIVAAPLTQSFGNLIRVFAWYDNEYAYALRLGELAKYISKR